MCCRHSRSLCVCVCVSNIDRIVIVYMHILYKTYGEGGLFINFSSSIGRAAAAVSISCQLLCVTRAERKFPATWWPLSPQQMRPGN